MTAGQAKTPISPLANKDTHLLKLLALGATVSGKVKNVRREVRKESTLRDTGIPARWTHYDVIDLTQSVENSGEEILVDFVRVGFIRNKKVYPQSVADLQICVRNGTALAKEGHPLL